MGELVQIKEKIEAKLKEKKLQQQRQVNAQASYTEMAKCLKVLEMNSMPELRNLKAVMRHTLKQMVDIGNGKKTNKR
tara:strand:+ start:496 stop:726 length:231 start_codon:yes stop_codon:yes gene_type:complete